MEGAAVAHSKPLSGTALPAMRVGRRFRIVEAVFRVEAGEPVMTLIDMKVVGLPIVWQGGEYE